jgi:hypothetical protein
LREIFYGVLDFTLRLRKLSEVVWIVGVRIFVVLQLGTWTLLARLRRFRSSHGFVSEITVKVVEHLKGIVIVISATHLMDRNEVLINIVLQELSVVL